MQGKRVIIILELEVLQPGEEVGHRIGSPVAINADGTLPVSVTADQNRPPNAHNNGDYKRVAVKEPVGSPATKAQRPSILDDPPRGQGM